MGEALPTVQDAGSLLLDEGPDVTAAGAGVPGPYDASLFLGPTGSGAGTPSASTGAGPSAPGTGGRNAPKPRFMNAFLQNQHEEAERVKAASVVTPTPMLTAASDTDPAYAMNVASVLGSSSSASGVTESAPTSGPATSTSAPATDSAYSSPYAFNPASLIGSPAPGAPETAPLTGSSAPGVTESAPTSGPATSTSPLSDSGSPYAFDVASVFGSSSPAPGAPETAPLTGSSAPSVTESAPTTEPATSTAPLSDSGSPYAFDVASVFGSSSPAPGAPETAPGPTPAPAKKKDPMASSADLLAPGKAPAPAKRNALYADEFDNYHESGVAQAFDPYADRASGYDAQNGEEMTHLSTKKFSPEELAARTAKGDTSGGKGVTGKMTQADGAAHDTFGATPAFAKIGATDTANTHLWALSEAGDMRTSDQTRDSTGMAQMGAAMAGNGYERPASAEDARAKSFPEQMNLVHHSSVGDGKDVKGAGMMKTKGGKVEQIDNESGHYQPSAENLYDSVDTLDKKGMGISHAVGGAGTKVKAFGQQPADALSVLAGQTPERVSGMQADMDAAGTSGPKAALGGVGEARITDDQAGLAMQYEGVIQRRREMEELRAGKAVSGPKK